MDGGASQRRENVLSGVAWIACQPLGVAVHQQCAVTQLLAVGGVCQQRVVGAVHIEFGIVARIAAVAHGEIQQFLTVGIKHIVDTAQARSALLKCHVPQGRPADVSGVVQRTLEVDSVRGCFSQRFFRGGVEQNGGFSPTLVPGAADVALELDH